MFYNGREVLSDHFQLILFWIPESSFCKKKNGIKWEERKEVPDLGKIPTFSRFVFGRLPLMNWHCICNIGIGKKLIYKDFGLFWAKVHCCNITKYQDFKMVPSEKLVSSTNGSFPQKYCAIRDGLPDHMVQKSCHCLN